MNAAAPRVAAFVLPVSPDRLGTLLCILAAAGFGAMAVLAKLAYGAGLGVVSLLSLRFVIAALVLWAAVAVLRVPLAGSGRALAFGALIGGGAYALEAGLFFAALARLDASLASLLLYAYPAFVTVAAIALGRERADRRRLLALAVASVGLVLVLGGGIGGASLAGVGLALGSALAYAAYILVSDVLARGLHPLAFAASVCTGAATAFLAAGAVSGGLDLSLRAEAWGWVLAIALISTVVAIAAFVAGLARVGPSRASILSTVEPPITVALAFLAFGETLGWVQAAGGLLVLSAAVLVVDQLDPDLAGEGGGELDEVRPTHPRPPQRPHAPQALEPAPLEHRPLQPSA